MPAPPPLWNGENLFSEIKNLIQILVADIEDDVVRCQFFILEVIRQPVVLFGEAGVLVKFSLIFQDCFTQVGNIVRLSVAGR